MRIIVLSGLILMQMTWLSGAKAEETGGAEPSLDLLEYLGSMVEQGDELIGPGDFSDVREPMPDSIVIDDPESTGLEVISHD